MTATINRLPLGRRRFDASRINHHILDGCFSVALALLLDVPAEAVPNFCFRNEAIPFTRRADRWVAETYGLSLIHFPMPWQLLTPPLLLAMQFDQLNPGVPFIMSGNSMSNPEAGHAVVCCAGDIIFDPFGSGVGSPQPDGHLVLTYLGGSISASALEMVQR